MASPRDWPLRLLWAATLLVCLLTPPLVRGTIVTNEFMLFVVTGGFYAASLASLAVWLTLGTEGFQRRMLIAWGLVLFGAAIFYGGFERLHDVDQWQALILVFLALQLPLWIMRYGGVRLRRSGDSSAPEFWRLQHFAVGAVLGGVLLTFFRGTARDNPNGFTWTLIVLPALAIVSLTPAVWYTLTARRLWRAHGWFLLHAAILLTPLIYSARQSSPGFGRAIAEAICWLAACSLWGGYAGLLVLWFSGYRLTRDRRTTPTTAAAPTSPRPGPE